MIRNKFTSNTDWLQVLEVAPKTTIEAGFVDETKQRCKYIQIISIDEIEGFWIIPVNALRRIRKGVWIKKDVLLAKVINVEFTPVINYLDKNRLVYESYVPPFTDLKPKNYFHGTGTINKY